MSLSEVHKTFAGNKITSAMAISIEALKRAERRTLGRAITLIESSRHDHRAAAAALLEQILPFTGQSIRIGITGVPGVGKSTFIDALGQHVIALGHKIAVLTIDPSSSINGGSILGDKTRMNILSAHESAFIRPSPSGNHLGGVARRTREVILLCEAAGFDVLIVETVGVGQSETLVAQMTDIFLLMLLPGGGDELQGIKRGIMELADIVTINKADGDLLSSAMTSIADVKQALNLIKPRLAKWQVPVLPTSAIAQNGIGEVWQQITSLQSHLSENDLLQARRKQQSANWLWQETADLLLDNVKSDGATAALLSDLQQAVRDEKITPSLAADQLVKRFLGKSR